MLGGVADNPAERLVSYVTSQRAALEFSLEIGDAVRRPLLKGGKNMLGLTGKTWLGSFLMEVSFCDITKG